MPGIGNDIGFHIFCMNAMKSGGGSVVLMSSAAALRGAGRQHIYAAVKGAIVSLTRTLAGTYARHGVRVMCCGAPVMAMP